MSGSKFSKTQWFKLAKDHAISRTVVKGRTIDTWEQDKVKLLEEAKELGYVLIEDNDEGLTFKIPDVQSDEGLTIAGCQAVLHKPVMRKFARGKMDVRSNDYAFVTSTAVANKGMVTRKSYGNKTTAYITEDNKLRQDYGWGSIEFELLYPLAEGEQPLNVEY